MAMDNGSPAGPQWTPEMRQMMEKVMPRDITALVKSLIPMLASQAFIFMGKAENPLQGRITKDLQQAHLGVECVIALLEKLDSHLTPDERTQLRQMAAELQMHYVEARKTP